ncbi:MAG: TetR/AcrR family transcriptional regulator [Lachnospiraceae bacterium]|nr:TetR/AcrR family transcriptional regulator [Lachnospiraceae bacterium]
MKKGERRKLELLDIAYGMFLSKGYENTSVDEIIEKANIAKGTFYYYFESKEMLLEEVIGMMIDKEIEAAKKILDADLSAPQKIAGIISSLRPSENELPIEDALMRPENIIMHDKVRKQLIEKAVPLISDVVKEGINDGLFECENVFERVRMVLVLSSYTFDENTYSEGDVIVFIDTLEKIFGAKPGTMEFIRGLIR